MPWPSPTEKWAQMHAVNLEAGFHLSRELARKLIADKEPGSFLLLTSLHSGTPRNLPHYSTAKAGLSMLVKELAKTFGRFDIRVNALFPARSPPAASLPIPGLPNTSRSAGSARPRTSRRWRSPCCRTGYRPTSPVPPS